MKLSFIIIGIAVVSATAVSFKSQVNKAATIVDKTIDQHGGKRYQNHTIEFEFRTKQYKAVKMKDGSFQYDRIFKESDKNVHDILNNDGFHRRIDNEKVKLEDKKSKAYSNSVNSVIYFALLPHGLNDEATKKEYLGEAIIHDKTYHKIRVTFNEKGGGNDFEDVFIYWIHHHDLTVDYLAYSYHINGGGVRFRAAYNRRKVNKITFQDYINYKSTIPSVRVEQLDSLYLKNELKELSRIELKNVKVTPI